MVECTYVVELIHREKHLTRKRMRIKSFWGIIFIQSFPISFPSRATAMMSSPTHNNPTQILVSSQNPTFSPAGRAEEPLLGEEVRRESPEKQKKLKEHKKWVKFWRRRRRRVQIGQQAETSGGISLKWDGISDTTVRKE